MWLDGAPLRGTIVGSLVEVVCGLYFLFQSLYGAQSMLSPWYPYGRCPYPPSRQLEDCEKWRARVVPVLWTYIFVTLALA